MPMKRNDKRLRFVVEYLKDFNATRAAKAAGYAEGSAHVAGARLLKDDKIKALIANEEEKLLAKSRLTTEQIIGMMEDIALEDIRGGFDEDGKLLPMSEWSDEFARTVESIETETEYDADGNEVQSVVVKLKRTPSKVGIDMLARHHSLYNDTMQHKGLEGLGERLKRGTERADNAGD